MAISTTDQNDLVIPLFEGLFEDPLWSTFLRRLLARTGAQRARLTLRNATAPAQPPLRLRVVTEAWRPSDDPGEPDVFDATAYAALRPNRVYSLGEMRRFDSAEARAEQDETLRKAAIGDARLIRVAGPGEIEAWIVLLHEREVFDAADSALLTALVPAMTAAMRTLATIGTLRRRAEMAEDALGLLGIGQAALDGEGRVLVADAVAERHFATPSPELGRACAELATTPERERKTLQLGPEERAVLLRPIPSGARSPNNPAVAIAAIRQPRSPDAASAAQVLAQTLGLSAREAALAEAMSRGVSIVEAGKALRLTPETARNYSKRIYAKTGVSGQADLVRLVLTGLAPLA